MLREIGEIIIKCFVFFEIIIWVSQFFLISFKYYPILDPFINNTDIIYEGLTVILTIVVASKLFKLVEWAFK